MVVNVVSWRMPVICMLAVVTAGGVLVYNNQSNKASQSDLSEKTIIEQSSVPAAAKNNTPPEKKRATLLTVKPVKHSSKKQTIYYQPVAAVMADADSNKRASSKQNIDDTAANNDDIDTTTPLDESLVLDYAGKKKPVAKTEKVATAGSETVIVNPATAKKGNAVHPQTGWDKFEKYVYDKAVSPDGKTGMVKLSFTVNTDGTLADFKVVKSVSTVADQMAIDIIKNGPGWMGETNGQARTITNTVQFHKAG
ncbi:MAG TPA: TonB family protein [Mucilaginibacter sp.]|jgi:TonB family protein|nr:TonB family protein [Mucilaginibacter sp.]